MGALSFLPPGRANTKHSDVSSSSSQAEVGRGDLIGAERGEKEDIRLTGSSY